MSSSESNRPAARETVPPGGADAAEPIRAIRLKHPGRIIFAVVLLFALALFIIDAAQREAYGWDNFAKYIFDRRISQAALNTLLLTIYSMAIAIVLGVVLSVMRLSDNPVVKGVSWLYLWVF
ncbi:MAG TPA: amino acid ABC transporter permease, partial [Protaetiibacter sp.]|nr:amino acid ABC transporter permease [Protaetiibacter sp.]